ncbi:E3 ubiquitin-protein ligase E3D isoform X1 [Conger conger]|uniref:E3 ubiquitin-protein ligase E3D isoform X1 n=1 Tax=Conger conger TaxID=82655 RepID=UPI002A5AA127|nr:E3 ubiquitin-protein ligase E3D isoform X1 [Conger conger]
MEEIHKQAGMFLELRQRLQTGLLILRSDVAGDPSEVTVSGGESSLQIKVPTRMLPVALPPGVALTEGSCRQVSNTGEEGLHLRLRLQVNQHTEAPGSVMKKLGVKKSYSFSCQRCRERVLTERVFQRVLPLPNGNWNTLVEDWCCHADPFANRKLLPRPGDCLLGDTYFLLLRDSQCDQTLRQEPSPAHIDTSHNQGSPQKPSRVTSVLCRACGAVLGETAAAETLKLYITELLVKRSDEDGEAIGNQHRWLFLEQTIAARLVELSSTQSMFRFSLQTPNGKAFILLWLLNSDSLVASLSWPDVCGDSSISTGDDVSVHADLSCGASSAVKVLYLPCAPSPHHITDAWEKDVSVHPLILPQTTCQEVIQLLTCSNLSLPPSLRRMNSYQVAFMRL